MEENIVAQLVEVESLAEGPCTVCGEPLNGLHVLAQAEALRERAAAIEALILFNQWAQQQR